MYLFRPKPVDFPSGSEVSRLFATAQLLRSSCRKCCTCLQGSPVGARWWNWMKGWWNKQPKSQRCATQVLCLIITPLVLLILILIAVFNVSWRTQMYKLWMCRVSDSQDYQVKRNQSSCAHDITKAWLLSWCLSMFVLHVAVGKSKGMLGTFADSAWCSYF